MLYFIFFKKRSILHNPNFEEKSVPPYFCLKKIYAI